MEPQDNELGFGWTSRSRQTHGTRDSLRDRTHRWSDHARHWPGARKEERDGERHRMASAAPVPSRWRSWGCWLGQRTYRPRRGADRRRPRTADVTPVVTARSSWTFEPERGTPLPSAGVDDFDSGAPFDAGHYYVVSPDGSRVYWEDTCCSATDVAARPATMGPQGEGRPAGPHQLVRRRMVARRHEVRLPAARWRPATISGTCSWKTWRAGRVTRVTDLEEHAEGLWYLAPTFSADGQNVIFQFPRDSSRARTWDLWSVPVTGGEPTLLAGTLPRPPPPRGRLTHSSGRTANSSPAPASS